MSKAPELDAEKLSRYVWFDVVGGRWISCCQYCSKDDIFFSGEPSELESSNWLTIAAQHVLDKHP